MQKWQDHADVQKVKQAYSILNNAFKLCVQENGTMDNWYWGTNTTFPYNTKNSEERGKLAECMLPYLKIQKYCGTNVGCAPNQTYYKTLLGETGIQYTQTNYFVGGITLLQNGTSFSIGEYQISKTGGTCWSDKGPIRVDINGNKGPNRYGYDVFFFTVSGNGSSLIPASYRCGGYGGTKASDFCSISTPAPISSHASGLTCSDWVIKHGNMDYKYRDVSAEW